MSKTITVQINLSSMMPAGYRQVKPGEKIQAGDLYLDPTTVNSTSISWLERTSCEGMTVRDSWYVTIRKIEPGKPPQKFLDQQEVELTGECRFPTMQDHAWAGATTFGDFSGIICSPSDYSCGNPPPREPRWILRAKQPPKPEYYDSVIKNKGEHLVFTNPNIGVLDSMIAVAPAVIGPYWKFVGFVWPEIPGVCKDYYSVQNNGVVKYATAVRFEKINK